MHALTKEAFSRASRGDLEERLAALEQKVEQLAANTPSNKATIVIFSSDLDKVLAGLVIATGAAAMGMEVSVFHTFWGLMPLRKGRQIEGKNLLESAMNLMTPAGLKDLAPSHMSYAGTGARILRKMMKDKGVQSPEELFELARELGVKFTACEMSMDVMGIRREELVDDVAIGGVASYLADAAESKVTLFI